MARRLTWFAAMCLLAASRPASADFFDDARKTVTTDIPHFFQDDVPCTFGGQPTSGARRSCQGEKPKAPSAARPAATPDRPGRR